MASGFDQVALAAALKVVYKQDRVEKLYNDEAVTLPLVRRAARKTEHGLVLRGLLDLRRIPGARAHPVGVAMPGDDRTIDGVASRLDADLVQWSMVAGRESNLVRIDGELADLADAADEGAFFDVATYRTEKAYRDMGRDRNAQLFRPRRGRLATVAATPAAFVVTLEAPDDLANAQELSTSHTVDGMAIRFTSNDGNIHRAVNASYEIVSSDPAANQITVNPDPLAAGDVVAGDQVTLGDDLSGAVHEEWDGFPVAGGDARWSASYLGLPRAVYRKLNGTVVDASPDAVNFGDFSGEAGAALFQRALDTARRRGGPAKVDHIVCRPEMLREVVWGTFTGAGSDVPGAVSNYRNAPGVAESGARKMILHAFGVGPQQLTTDVDATPHTLFAWADDAVVVWDAIPTKWVSGYTGELRRFILDLPNYQYVGAVIEASAFMARNPTGIIQITNIRHAIDAA